MKKTICILLILLFCVTFSVPSVSAESVRTASDDAGIETAFSTDSFAESVDESVMECPNLAVTGELVWRIVSGQICCEQPQTGQTAATLPLSSFLRDGETADYTSVVSWSEDSVLVLLSLHREAGTRLVTFLELCLEEDAVVLRRQLGSTEKLNFLFSGESEWYQFDTMSIGESIFVAALDPQFSYHLFLYTPDGDSLLSLGEWHLDQYASALPYGEDVLLLGPNELDSNTMELTVLSPSDGSTRLLRSVHLDYPMWFFNFAYNEAENQLCFTMDNVAYCMTPDGDDTPAAFATVSSVPAMLPRGVMVGNSYTFCSEDGSLLSMDVNLAFTAQELRILDPLGLEQVTGVISKFGADHPEYIVTIVQSGEETDILTSVQKDPEQYDAYVVPLNSDAFRFLCRNGFAADLSGNELLVGIVGNASEPMQAALEVDGNLPAFPISAENYCQILNISAITELTGLSREKIPTDWPGFLKLLQKLAKNGTIINNPDCRLYLEGISAEEFRDTLFSWLLQDCFLWVYDNPDQIANLQKAALPALKEFNKVNWIRLGYPEENAYGFDYGEEEDYGGFSMDDSSSMGFSLVPGDDTDGFFSSSGDADFEVAGVSLESVQETGTTILSDGLLSIEVMMIPDGEEFWPLSLQPGGKRLISQDVTVICVNPHSPNQEGVMKFLEYLWQETDPTVKMTIDQSLNEPVLNQNYLEDLEFFSAEAENLNRQLREERDPLERKRLSVELQQLQSLADDYREKAYWAASEESIAYYRSLSGQMIPFGNLWNDLDIDHALLMFLNGEFTPKQFLKQLTEAMK